MVPILKYYLFFNIYICIYMYMWQFYYIFDHNNSFLWYCTLKISPSCLIKLSRVELVHYLDGRWLRKTKLLLDEVLRRPAVGACEVLAHYPLFKSLYQLICLHHSSPPISRCVMGFRAHWLRHTIQVYAAQLVVDEELASLHKYLHFFFFPVCHKYL